MKSNADELTQSLLKDAAIVEGKHPESAIKLKDSHQQKTDILRGDNNNNEIVFFRRADSQRHAIA